MWLVFILSIILVILVLEAIAKYRKNKRDGKGWFD